MVVLSGASPRKIRLNLMCAQACRFGSVQEMEGGCELHRAFFNIYVIAARVK